VDGWVEFAGRDNMTKETHIAVFNGSKIRKIWFAERWWFVVEDVISVLTDSNDPKQYIQKLKKRDETLSQGWVQIVHTLSIQTAGGKQPMNCSDTEGIFRIIQSVPSKKAEPFKRWLARVGYERVQEIENPELAQERMKEIYEKKGYHKNWIDKRLRGIAIRQNLTDEWKNRGVEENAEYAILTNEIAKATFGISIDEHKKIKEIDRENLRDYMTDLELIFSMLGEASTTEISKEKNTKGFSQNLVAAKLGGDVAGKARKDLEKKSGKKIVTNKNPLDEEEIIENKKEEVIENVN
jgi:DNA-damage-inducible protein D